MISYPSIVDTHVHFWDPQHLRYAWLDALPELNRPFLPSDWAQAVGSLPIEKFIFVEGACESAQSLQEVRWIAEAAANEPRLAGIVAHAPLEKGSGVVKILEELARQPLVKGIRRILQGESDPEFCLQPSFVEGVQLLARFDFSFDVCIAAHQMPAVIELVRRCPQVRFLLDHLGKPAIREQRVEPWRGHLAELARLPNAWCKISGLVTEADHQAWNAADLAPYLEHALDCFGFDRVVFGGDWPVCTLATQYRRWVDTLLELLAGTPTTELTKLFHSNAERCYRL